jgi:hypothetical protein
MVVKRSMTGWYSSFCKLGVLSRGIISGRGVLGVLDRSPDLGVLGCEKDIEDSGRAR